jgi:hypothetical protein
LPVQEHKRQKRNGANQCEGERARHTAPAEAPKTFANTACATPFALDHL